ncbi:MAG: family 78 glycoside hydrolase catalytic domain [Phycisphaerales bacterium]|nr:MAG: family 78 glycoside hydrolase catalytic domain [Phycisphaerales bacterium]
MNGIRFLSAAVTALLLLSVSGCTDESTIETDAETEIRQTSAKYLRCEYRIDPLGIDVTNPRLSWIMESPQRSQVQRAYQILVAHCRKCLEEDKGDLWDSGKVSSDGNNQVVYEGKPLQSRMRCFWKVRVWDTNGRVSAWSEPAMWTVGLLEQDDWRAKWIGYDAEPPAIYKLQPKPGPLDLKGSKWIWLDEGEPQKNAPLATRFFRRGFEISRQVKRARFALLADNDAVLFINGRETARISGWQDVNVVDVSDKLVPGGNIFAIAVTNKGDAANPAGLAGKLVVEYQSGDPTIVSVDRSWKVSGAERDGWEKPEFDDTDWSASKEIADLGDAPWGEPARKELVLPPPPYLRKIFFVNKPVERAVVYASALGLYELRINGKRVGADYFTPGWTDYNIRAYYQTYDVTDLLGKDGNAIGAILADGWYAGYLGFGKKREHYGDKPRLSTQLEIEYTDGSMETVVTDNSWKAAYGPLFESDFLMGETYDARKEKPGWSTYLFNDSAWDAVAVTDKIEAKIQSYPGVTVKKILEIKPKTFREPVKGAYVFDMGQNFAGWVRLKVKGKAGTKVVLRFAEMLNPDGTIYTTNLRSARCTDTYILRGAGEEIWEPRFTFHGFRYVEVTGYPGKPAIDAITGVVLHSDAPLAGSFECSNPMVNQLFSNIVWSQRGNFIEIPTDCPQRDERLGWTGDAQIFIRAATYNMDVAAFFTKWLVDLQDAQTPQGAFPDVAPHKVAMGSGVPAWGDAGVICPWTIYKVYGDRRVLERHYASMERWITYLGNNSKRLLRPAYGYGDWVSIGSKTPKDVIATAYFAYSARLVSKAAAALGKSGDAKKYEGLFRQIREAFNNAYVSEDARVKGETQTCYLLALYFDLLPQEKRPLAAKHLVEAIRKKNWHLSTGFVGLSYLLPTLTDVGRLDVAYRLLANETFPSWGYSIKNGATTIWERWDGWTEEKGFQTPAMNSFNHYAFGSVGRWLFDTVAGIDTDGPGFKKIIIRPRPGDITYARASYESINGTIVSDWKLEGKAFRLKITIPANTTATVHIPARNTDGVTEGGRPATESPAVRFLRMDDGAAVFAVGSGDYEFMSHSVLLPTTHSL